MITSWREIKSGKLRKQSSNLSKEQKVKLMLAKAGDCVKVEKKGRIYRGILMPPSGDYIVIKLDSGYNVGIKLDSDTKIEVIKLRSVELGRTIALPAQNPALPRISIISTGGTIASRVDYRTGAVSPQFNAEDILSAIPELTEIANLDATVLCSIFSENMTPDIWIDLARAVAKKIEEGASGILITHGTDTMGYTAAALSFMVQTPVPVVLTGSQRSADRPSSDSVINAVCAAAVATSDIAEVVVVMHGSTSDDFCCIHRGTKVRKMHSSRRDAFKSINDIPLGIVEYPSRRITVNQKYVKRGERQLLLRDKLEQKCTLIKFHPGMSVDILRYYIESGYKGIVLEGTGLGHVNSSWLDYLKKVDIPIVMTSQCLHGRVCDRVYDTGRDLLKAGIIEGEDMLPEVALVKLMWALGQSSDREEIKRIMQTNIAGEITGSSKHEVEF
jgi:glutamyl-tRNA(Gln) amidotransferase subunit D